MHKGKKILEITHGKFPAGNILAVKRLKHMQIGVMSWLSLFYKQDNYAY